MMWLIDLLTDLGPTLLLGSTLLLGTGALGVVLARAESTAQRPPAWIEEVYQRLSKTRTARLLVSSGLGRPFSYGILRPTIMLPAEISQPEHARPMEHVLRHEQAHVQRRDAWGHALVNLAFPVLYVNPFYWWLRGRIQFARELIADDWATADGSKSCYAQDLLQLLRRRDVSLAGPIGVMGVYLRNPLARRMKMLLQRDGRLSPGVSRTWIVVTTAGAVLLVAVMSSLLGLRMAAGGPSERTDWLAPGPAAPVAVSGGQTVAASEPVSPGKVADSALAPVDGAHEPPTLSLPLATARQPVPSRVISPCQVMPVDDVLLPAREQGVIAAIEAREGSGVKAGQLIARIDDEVAVLQTEAARLGAQVSKEQAGNVVDIHYAEKAADVASAELKEAEKARHSAVITQAEVRRRTLAAERARLQIEQAKSQYAIARASHRQKMTESKAAEAKITRLRILAPFPGIVTNLFVQRGSWVNPGDPICRILSLNRMRVDGYVRADKYNPEEIFGRKVTVTVRRARGEEVQLESKISYVSPVVESSGEFRVWAEVENPVKNGHHTLRPGMSAQMIIDKSPTPPTVDQHVRAVSGPAVAEPSPGEIHHLTELVAAYESTWKQIHALYEAGSQGGEAENEAAARNRLCTARARLALARGDTAEAIRQYEAAVQAAEIRVTACQQAWRGGRVVLGTLLDAQAERTETKMRLSQLRRK